MSDTAKPLKLPWDTAAQRTYLQPDNLPLDITSILTNQYTTQTDSALRAIGETAREVGEAQAQAALAEAQAKQKAADELGALATELAGVPLPQPTVLTYEPPPERPQLPAMPTRQRAAPNPWLAIGAALTGGAGALAAFYGGVKRAVDEAHADAIQEWQEKVREAAARHADAMTAWEAASRIRALNTDAANRYALSRYDRARADIEARGRARIQKAEAEATVAAAQSALAAVPGSAKLQELLHTVPVLRERETEWAGVARTAAIEEARRNAELRTLALRHQLDREMETLRQQGRLQAIAVRGQVQKDVAAYTEGLRRSTGAYLAQLNHLYRLQETRQSPLTGTEREGMRSSVAYVFTSSIDLLNNRIQDLETGKRVLSDPVMRAQIRRAIEENKSDVLNKYPYAGMWLTKPREAQQELERAVRMRNEYIRRRNTALARLEKAQTRDDVAQLLAELSGPVNVRPGGQILPPGSVLRITPGGGR